MLRAISARAFCLLLCRRSASKASKPKDKTEISEIDATPLSKEFSQTKVAPGEVFDLYFAPSTRAPALAGGSCSGFRPTNLPVGLHLYSGAFSNCSKPQARSTPVVAARFGSAAISKATALSLALKCWKTTPSGLIGSWNRSLFFQS